MYVDDNGDDVEALHLDFDDHNKKSAETEVDDEEALRDVTISNS